MVLVFNKQLSSAPPRHPWAALEHMPRTCMDHQPARIDARRLQLCATCAFSTMFIALSLSLFVPQAVAVPTLSESSPENHLEKRWNVYPSYYGWGGMGYHPWTYYNNIWQWSYSPWSCYSMYAYPYYDPFNPYPFYDPFNPYTFYDPFNPYPFYNAGFYPMPGMDPFWGSPMGGMDPFWGHPMGGGGFGFGMGVYWG